MSATDPATVAALESVPGVVGVSSVAPTLPVSTVTTSKKGNFMSVLLNKSFQTFMFAVIAFTGLVVLMALGTLNQTTGLPLLTLIGGFGIGVPVSTGGTGTAG